MPIERGAGINQRMLHAFAARAIAGDWLHIFPEGTICQSGKITGRVDADGGLVMGRLKWGVGKLIAVAAAAAAARGENAGVAGAAQEGIAQPLVVPMYHCGMQQIIEQVNDTGRTKSWWPGTGKELLIKIGDPVDFSDILERHGQALAACAARQSVTSKGGKVETDGESGTQKKGNEESRGRKGLHDGWESLSQQELRLFHELTSRVEEAMSALEKEAHNEYREIYSRDPPSDEKAVPAYRRPNIAKLRAAGQSLRPAYQYPLQQPFVTPGNTMQLARKKTRDDAQHADRLDGNF